MIEFYDIHETSELKELLVKIDKLKLEINNYRPLHQDIWKTIQQKLKVIWTYNSNAIEGSSLTQSETTFFLQYGLTVEGKPLKDFLDAKNHSQAIDYLQDVIKNNRQLTEGLIKEINSLLLSGVDYTVAVNQFGQEVKKPLVAGKYKTLPNHVLQLDGTIHYYVDPLQVSVEMEYLIKWINENMNTFHPLITGAIAHYNMVRIHPFDDGNGRGARILMNLILMKNGYQPAIIKNEQRRLYIESINEADKGNLNPFTKLVAKSLVETQETILEDLNK
jgi:Fic family protein